MYNMKTTKFELFCCQIWVVQLQNCCVETCRTSKDLNWFATYLELTMCGSRIPGHWIQAPPPADSVWASYMKRPETDNKCLMEESKAIFKAGQKRKKLSQQQQQ
jgi:hypothetical protein